MQRGPPAKTREASFYFIFYLLSDQRYIPPVQQHLPVFKLHFYEVDEHAGIELLAAQGTIPAVGRIQVWRGGRFCWLNISSPQRSKTRSDRMPATPLPVNTWKKSFEPSLFGVKMFGMYTLRFLSTSTKI